MSVPTHDAAGDRPLQFDAAEPLAPAEPLACTSCAAPIRAVYHEANGAVICSACRGALERRLGGGSSVGRFARALALGGGAACVGAALYFAIALFFGIELGLIAIVVGWLVGRAVLRGSRGRGGWRYQTLAVVLTYSAIVVTYIPQAFDRASGGLLSATAADTAAAAPEHAPRVRAPALAIADVADTAPESPASGLAAPEDAATGGAGHPALVIAAGLAVLVALAWAEPFRLGAENLMGLVIIAIGLYQAWHQTQPALASITGPYAIGAPRDPAP